MTPGPGIEPGPHWWKASALTTAPSLLPMGKREQGERRGGESSKLGWIKISSNPGEIAKLFLATCFGNKELVAGFRPKLTELTTSNHCLGSVAISSCTFPSVYSHQT